MAGTDKLWLDLGGQPLLARTIAAIADTPGLVALVVVGSPDLLARTRPIAHQDPWTAVTRWIPGGLTRQDSVYCGLEALPPCALVLVHDGARPLVTFEMLERGVEAARAHGAVVAGMMVTDTIKVVDELGLVTATLDRATLRAAQTPQVFAEPIIRSAYAQVGTARATCTDDAGVLELAGFPVHTYPGERTNIKVSTPDDVAIVRALWTGRQGGT